MSATSQGHGWWLASDGNWYPPEAWTGPPPQTGQPPQTAAGYPVGYQAVERSQGYPVQGYPVQGYAVQGYPAQGHTAQGYPVAGYPSAGYPPHGASWNASPTHTDGLAIASLACACAGIIPFLFGLPLLLGIVFGFVARSQIRNAREAQDGPGWPWPGSSWASASSDSSSWRSSWWPFSTRRPTRARLRRFEYFDE
jgi:hypothetical protein